MEIGEVEEALRRQEGVREAAVVVVEDEVRGKWLVGYVEGDVDEREVRLRLRAELPEDMAPGEIVKVVEMPLTAAGKVDRGRLPAVGEARERGGVGKEGALTAEEEIIQGIWRKLLGVEGVGAEENFFDVGGHSLLGTQMAWRMEEVFGIELGLREVFEAGTVREIAELVKRRLEGAEKISLPELRRASATVSDNGVEEWPLSYAQRRLWFLDQLHPGSPLYNIPAAVRLRGKLDIDVLERSLGEIIRRHEALRTVFHVADGEPVQTVQPAAPFTMPVIDLSDKDEAVREAEAQRLIREEARRPFDLSCGPLLRVALLKLDAADHVALLNMHHIIADGWSMGILTREMIALYDAFAHDKSSPLPELPIQYADFASWQRQWFQGERLQAQTRYWREQLEGAPWVLDLPTDKARTSGTGHSGAIHPISFSRQLSEDLHAQARNEDLTLFMLLLAGFNVLLYRYTGQRDILVGTPIAGRIRAETENLIGFFVNTLVLRTRINGKMEARELLDRIRETCLGGYAHQEMPFEMLVEQLQPDRNTNRTPLFQVMLALQNAPGWGAGQEQIMQSGGDIAGPRISVLESGSGTAKFDLTLSLAETENGLHGAIEYRTDLFEATTIERMAARLERMLTALASGAEQPLGYWPLLSAEEKEVLSSEWGRTARPYPAESNIVAQFAAQVAHHPHSTALISGPDTLSYLDLDRRSNQLAHFLLDHHLNPEAPIALLVSRSSMMIVSLLGVLKAGGAYLPLDLQSPPARQAAMLTRAGVRLALTDQPLAAAALSQTGLWSGMVIDLNGSAGEMSGQPRTPPPIQLHPEMLAYIIHTSGSTGEPKGVAVTHRNVLRLVCNNTYARLDERTRMLQLAPLAFDALTMEVWGPLLNGGCVAQSGMETPRAKELREEIARHGITTLFLTTALFNAVVDEDARALEGLEELLLGGEAASVKHVKRAQEALPEVMIRNAYGPTEATTITSCHVVGDIGEEEVSIPIGSGIGNTEVYVLDEMMELAPEGVVGELYIGGAGLGRGYYGRGDETGERFAPHPYSEEGGERLYRSGDQVRWRKGGVLEYVGRRDGQVKLRGY